MGKDAEVDNTLNKVTTDNTGLNYTMYNVAHFILPHYTLSVYILKEEEQIYYKNP